MAHKVHLFRALVLVVLIAIVGGCADGNLKEARRYQKDGNYGQAVYHYKLALDKDPDNRSIRYGLVEALAQQLMQTPQEQLTAEVVEKTMQEVRPIAQPLMDDANIKRYVSLIYQLLAQRYGDQGMDENAADTWAEVIKVDPLMTEAHYNLGVSLAKMGKDEEALPHFEKSIELNPYFLKGYYAMGNSFLKMGQHEDAIEQYLKALEISPDDAEARHNLGVAYSYAGKTEEAIASLEKAIELKPEYFLAYRSLSSIYQGLGNTEKVAEIDKKWEEYAAEQAKMAEPPDMTGDSD